MNFKEILLSQGVTDEQAEKVLDEMKQNKIYLSSEENLDIRYTKLKTDHEGKVSELEKANSLIAELQKSNKDNTELQEKVNEYQKQVENLQAENQKIKMESTLKFGLLSEKALDVDYLIFKLQEAGDLTLDDNGEIKGWKDKVAELKSKYPSQFEGAGTKRIEEKKLEPTASQNLITLDQFKKMGYTERAKLRASDPESYTKLSSEELK